MESKLAPDEMVHVAALANKLSQIINDVARVPKNGINQHFKYPFATESDIKDTIRPALAKHNIAFLSQIVRHEQVDKRATIEMEFTFICGDTGASITRRWINHADDAQDKGIAKAATLCTKYFLINCFLISTGDEELDPDSGIQRKKSDKIPTTNGKPSTSTGNSTGDVHGAPQATQGWATIKTVDYLLAAARTTFPSLSQAEFIKAAGITSYTAYDEWNEKYTAGIEASAAIKEALEAEPVTPSTSPLPVNGEGQGVGSKKSAFSKPSFPVIRGATPRPAATIAITSVTYEPVNRAHRWGTGYTEDGYHVEMFESDKAMFKQLGCDVEIWIERAGSTHKNAYALDRPVTVITQQEQPHRIDEAATLALYLQSVSF